MSATQIEGILWGPSPTLEKFKEAALALEKMVQGIAANPAEISQDAITGLESLGKGLSEIEGKVAELDTFLKSLSERITAVEKTLAAMNTPAEPPPAAPPAEPVQ